MMKLKIEIPLLLIWFTASAGEVHSAEIDQSARDVQAGLSSLPLSEVVLYSSGVGYFRRTGSIEGNASVELQFKVDDINDLLKSMVVQDYSGGEVASVSYSSRDPLSKSLKSFAIDLTANPSLGQLLDQVRGEAVEIMRPGPLQGTILGIERKAQLSGDQDVVQTEFLNMLTADGLQSIPMSQVHRIRLLNQRVDAELRQALELLASSHDTQKKSVTIRFDGEGKRDAGISYVMQTPVWKTSYRLVLDENGRPFLQGWAIVENTSDEDWNDVALSLISGRPISFSMDLYQPLYTTRPVVEPELYSSLRPQLYGQAMESADKDLARKSPAPRIMADSMERRAAAKSPTFRSRSSATTGGRGGLGAQRESSSNFATLSLQEGVTSAAQGSDVGELFHYEIKAPVTLARQQSALLPIVNQIIEGTKVSIYNESVHAKRPLNGFRIKNSTPLHLMQGPITVFDGDAYAGDARIDDLAPNQERLLSYAIDLKVEVEPQHHGGAQQLLTSKIKRGVMTLVRKVTDRKTYTVRNRDSDEKSIIIEHPLRSGWDLISPSTPSERTRDSYRFVMNVDSDETEKLEVREERRLSEDVRLLNLNSDRIAFYLKARELSSQVKSVLEQVVRIQNQINETRTERTRREKRIAEISQEQTRIRDNMARLDASSELFARYIKKLDDQETELDNFRAEIEALKELETTQQKDLNDYLLAVDLG